MEKNHKINKNSRKEKSHEQQKEQVISETSRQRQELGRSGKHVSVKREAKGGMNKLHPQCKVSHSPYI